MQRLLHPTTPHRADQAEAVALARWETQRQLRDRQRLALVGALAAFDGHHHARLAGAGDRLRRLGLIGCLAAAERDGHRALALALAARLRRRRAA